MLKKLKRVIKNNIYFFFLAKYLIALKNKLLYSNSRRAEKYLEKQYKLSVEKELDFSKKMETFTEKVQYRKLYPNNSLFTTCADKYLVREYVKEKIGEEYLIPLYLVTEKLTLDQWKELPNSFIVKPNHDSGNFEIVQDKRSLNKSEIKKIITKMNLALKINFGWFMLERHYIDIKPRIIIEKLLSDKDGRIPKDYKLHCFKKRILIQIIERDIFTHKLKMNYLNEKLEKLNFETGGELLDKIDLPFNFNKMLELAKKLSEDFDYVRVDFYNVDGRIYFGELTFTPFSGLGKFNPEKWDKKLGEYWYEN